MSEEIATLGIKVDTSDVKRGADDLDKLAGAGKRAEKSTDGVSDGFRTMATAIAGLGLGATVREFIQAADAMDSMSARLKLVTTSSREAVDVQSKLVDLANANRAGLQETVSLFTKIADPVKRAGGSMADSLKIVDSFAKTLKISGASAQEAAAATYQFAQAMASGKLAGDEFRSLAEASPRFLSAMAEGMNVPREALKKLSEEGKLTIDVVGNALMKMQGQLTTEFAVLPTTVADAMTQIKNEILVGVQEINTAGGFTQGIVAGLEEVKDFMPGFKATLLEAAKGFEGLEQQTSFVEVGLTTLRYTMETLLVVGGNLAYMAQAAGRELGGMAAQMAALGRGDFAAFTSIGEAMREDAKTAKKSLDDYEKRVMGAYATQEALRNDATNSRADMYKNWLRQDAEFAAQSLKIIVAYAGQSVEVQQAAMAEYVKNFYAKSAAGGGLKAPSSGGDIDKLKKDIEDLAKLLDRINGKDVGLDAGYWKDLNTLHAAYAKGKLSLDAYAKTVGNLTKQQQFSKDLISEETKAKEALVRQNEEYARSVQSALSPLEQQARMLELEVVNYGLTEAAIQSNIITRMEEARALAAANGAWPEHLNYLDQEIALRRRIATASSQKEFLDTNKRAAEQSAKEWEKFSDDINRALTDALMRGFEDGKSFGQNFVDSLKNSLKSAALKIVVNMVTSTGGSLVNAGINVLAGTSGSNGGTGTNYLGLANNASSAYNLYNTSGLAYQYLSGSMSGANALGTGYANLTNTGIDGLLATNNAFGTAATETAGASAGSSAATAGLGYFAAAAAAILAIKYFNDRSRPLPLEFTGLAVDGQYDGKNFDGTLATNYMRGGSYWDQRMPLTSDAAIVAQNYQNLKPPVIEIANPDYTTWQNAYQEAGFQNQIGDNAYLNGEVRVDAPSRISGYDEGYTPAPYSTDPNILGNIDAAIEAAFNAPKSAMKKVAELFGDAELVTQIDAFTAKISVSGQTIGEILGKIGAQVTTDLGQAFLPAVEAARVQGAALRTGLETAIANATTAGDTEAVNTLKAQMEAIGIAASETWSQTFERVLKETDAVSKAMDLLGVSLKDIGDANKVLTLSDNLVTLFGGIDALNTSVNAYYGNFYTEAEKQTRAWEQIGKAFASLNLSTPKTREGFRALVDAQDLTTTAGQATFKALMGLQGAFAELVPAMEAAAAAVTEVAVTAAQLRSAKSTLMEYFNVDQQRMVLTGEIASAAQENGVNLDGQSLTNLGNATRQQFAHYVQTVANEGTEASRRMLVALAAIAPAFEDLVAIAEAAAAADLQAAIDKTQSAIDALTGQYGDVATTLQDITAPAKNLVDTWRTTVQELDNLQAAFDNLFGGATLSLIEQAAQTAALRDTFASGAGNAQDAARNARVGALAPAEQAAFWQRQEQSLWQGLGTATDKGAVINQIMQAYANARNAEYAVLEAEQGTTQKTALQAQIDAWRDTLSLIERSQSLVKDIDATLAGLAYSELSNLGYTDQLGAAASSYSTTLGKAAGGDATAMGDVTRIARDYLTEAQTYFGGATLDYSNVYDKVTGDLRGLGMGLNTDGAGAQSEIDRLTASLSRIPGDLKAAFDTQTAEGYERIATALDAGTQYSTARLDEQKAQLQTQIDQQKVVIANQEAQIRQQADNHAALMERLAEQNARLAALESNSNLTVAA